MRVGDLNCPQTIDTDLSLCFANADAHNNHAKHEVISTTPVKSDSSGRTWFRTSAGSFWFCPECTEKITAPKEATKVDYPIELSALPTCTATSKSSSAGCMNNYHHNEYKILSKATGGYTDEEERFYYRMEKLKYSDYTDTYWICRHCHEAVQALLNDTPKEGTITSTPSVKVQTGFHSLVEHFGHPGFATSIDLNTLNLEDGSKKCVLAQVFGSYVKGLKALGITDVEAATRGFVAGGDVTGVDLTSEWTKVLKDFRSGGTVPMPTDYKSLKTAKKVTSAKLKTEKTLKLELIDKNAYSATNINDLKAFIASCEEAGLSDLSTVVVFDTERSDSDYSDEDKIVGASLTVVLPL